MWGYHLTVDCRACDIKKITSVENIYNFTKELVDRIDMVAYGEPQIVMFGSDDKAGFTLVQLIETSNICAHFCNDTGDAYIDVFSCKPFDQDEPEKVISKYFHPSKQTSHYRERQA